MEKMGGVLLASLVTASSIGLTNQTYAYTNQRAITITALNMRDTNSTSGKIIALLNKGTELEIINKMSNGWYEVKFNQTTGYVSGQYIKILEENNNNSQISTNEIGITTAPLNLRETNSTSGRIITVLKKGTEVEVLNKMSDGWYKVKCNGRIGYVSGLYIKLTKSNLDKTKFKEIQDIVKKDQTSSSITKLVNKKNNLSSSYKPMSLVKPNVSMSKYVAVTKTTSTYLTKMFNDAKQNGINLTLVSGYRPYSYQKSLYKNNLSLRGKAYVDKFIAKPGQSEHQTGLAVDISSKQQGYKLVNSFGETKEGKWLAQNAHKYGFILRYTKDRVKDTGYAYEPWHFRYVGQEVATYIYENNLIFEDLF